VTVTIFDPTVDGLVPPPAVSYVSRGVVVGYEEDASPCAHAEYLLRRGAAFCAACTERLGRPTVVGQEVRR
jgi:hypothetical protein